MKIRLEGSKVETYYTYYDEEEKEHINIKTTERFDDEGKPKGICEIELIKRIGGSKGVEITKNVWETHFKEK